PPPAMARRGHRPSAVLPDPRRGADRRRRLRDHAGYVGTAGGHAHWCDRDRVLHTARHRIRAGADRSAQARAHGGRCRCVGGRPVRRRARRAGRPDVVAATLLHVPRHAHDRCRRGLVARRCHARSGHAVGARSPASGAAEGGAQMTTAAAPVTRAVSAAFGLVMVASAAVPSARPGVIAANAAEAAQLMSRVFTPDAAVYVTLTVPGTALAAP